MATSRCGTIDLTHRLTTSGSGADEAARTRLILAKASGGKALRRAETLRQISRWRLDAALKLSRPRSAAKSTPTSAQASDMGPSSEHVATPDMLVRMQEAAATSERPASQIASTHSPV